MNKDISEIKKEILALNPKVSKQYIEYNISAFEQINELLKRYLKFDLNSIEKEFQIIKYNLLNPLNQSKLICLMIQTNYLIYNYYPRYPQLLALLFFINKNQDKGLIQEIKTGEGKSLVIAFFAAYNYLVYKKKVDILTSSIILAERDCLLYKQFYEVFGIKTDFCREPLDPTKKYRLCYSTDILYGDCLNFEADILRAVFLGIPGRKIDRGYECIIIDEIDNICIDNIKNITELLDDFPGYKALEYIYIYIYNLLIEIDIKYKKDKFLIITNKDGIIRELTHKLEDFLEQNKKNNIENIYYPIFLHDYILLRKNEWCKSAYEAKYEFELNKQYIISQNEDGIKTIKPIDYSNTGVIQQNSVWPGLHQFLEIKEGLRLTEENLNSCYMSNLTFFKKYKNNRTNNIYGVTGTLDTEKTQLALEKIYNMEFILMPTFKQSLLIPPTYTVLDEKKKYLNKIIEKIKQYSQNRAVLVIFEYIENIKEISKKLKLEDSIDENKIIIYKDSENSQESLFLKREINIGNIILATNLAARGTDIKISHPLNENGGLHVILTFFPNNERVEKQALGRAGRKGENGSGELIIFSFDETIDKMKSDRLKRENDLYNELINKFLIRDCLYERLFDKFCQILIQIREKKIENEKELILDLKEKWGFFLVKNNINNLNGPNDKNKEIIDKNFTKLYNEINGNIYTKYKFRNPLIESNSIYLENLKRIVEECKMYSIGANYYIIYLLVKRNEDVTIIKKYLNELHLRLEKFVTFFDEILKPNILKILNYENSNYHDIEEQINEKKEIFSYILANITSIINALDCMGDNIIYKINNNKRDNIKDLKRRNGKNYNKDIINYIYDLGIYFLYRIKLDGKNNYCHLI